MIGSSDVNIVHPAISITLVGDNYCSESSCMSKLLLNDNHFFFFIVKWNLLLSKHAAQMCGVGRSLADRQIEIKSD